MRLLSLTQLVAERWRKNENFELRRERGIERRENKKVCERERIREMMKIKISSKLVLLNLYLTV